MASCPLSFLFVCVVLLAEGTGTAAGTAQALTRRGGFILEVRAKKSQARKAGKGRARDGEASGRRLPARRELAARSGGINSSLPTEGAVHPDDAATLLRLAAQWTGREQGVGGPGYYYAVDDRNLLATWSAERPCSQWYGVTCDSGTRRVTAIDLPSQKPSFWLYGSLPPLLGSLPELRSLILAQNDMTCWDAPFPTEWARLGKLARLDLSGNSLGKRCDPPSLSVPPVVGNLTSLTYLNLADTGLTTFFDPLPEELKQLSQLVWLDLSDNRFGSASNNPCHMFFKARDLRVLASLSSLKSLFLAGVGYFMSASDSLSRLQDLEQLDLSGSARGSFPPFMGNLTRLADLRLSGAVAADTRSVSVPSWLSSLQQLTWLDLSANNLTGSIPDWLGALTGLATLDLSSNQLTGSLSDPLFLSGRNLSVANNQLSGVLPPSALTLMAQRLVAAGNGSSLPGQLNVSGNYLTGPCYSPVMASLACPQDKNRTCVNQVSQELQCLARNCLQECSEVPSGMPPPQRSGAECAQFSPPAGTAAPSSAAGARWQTSSLACGLTAVATVLAL